MPIYDSHLRLDVVVHGYWGNARLVNGGTSEGRVSHCHNVMAQNYGRFAIWNCIREHDMPSSSMHYRGITISKIVTSHIRIIQGT
jgi:hypothetical protein